VADPTSAAIALDSDSGAGGSGAHAVGGDLRIGQARFDVRAASQGGLGCGAVGAKVTVPVDGGAAHEGCVAERAGSTGVES
jgi:hypothetical protein